MSDDMKNLNNATKQNKNSINRTDNHKRVDIQKIALAGVLSALTLALAMIPQIGYIVIPGLGVQITTVHIPVIISGIVGGPAVGGFVGLIFGLSSLYQAVISPLPIAFAFLNPLVSIVPRILIGVVSYYVYKLVFALTKGRSGGAAAGIAAALGTLTNTIGVLGMIYVLYAERYLQALGLSTVSPFLVIFGMALPNGPAELLAAVIVAIPVVAGVKKVYNPELRNQNAVSHEV